MDGRFRYSEIEDMKVRDILDLLDERKAPEKTEEGEAPEVPEDIPEDRATDDADVVLAEAELVIDK